MHDGVESDCKSLGFSKAQVKAIQNFLCKNCEQTATVLYLWNLGSSDKENGAKEFVVRNDMGCGSTIGPILALGVSIRTVDCGIPHLFMHSEREVCGKEDVDTAKHFTRHFRASIRS